MTNKATEPSDLRKIKVVKVGRMLLLDGTQDWATPCEPWLCTHDIFHHAPGDTGGLIGEAMSFGTEAWLEHHTDELTQGVSYTSLSAILEEIAVEHKKAQPPSQERLKAATTLTESAPPFSQIEDKFRTRFSEITEEAVQESALSPAFAWVDDATAGSMCSEANIENISNWMAYGFAKAQLRFPDPVATRVLFNDVSHILDRWERTDLPSIEFAIDERRATLHSNDPVVIALCVSAGARVQRLEPTRQREPSGSIQP